VKSQPPTPKIHPDSKSRDATASVSNNIQGWIKVASTFAKAAVGPAIAILIFIAALDPNSILGAGIVKNLEEAATRHLLENIRALQNDRDSQKKTTEKFKLELESLRTSVDSAQDQLNHLRSAQGTAERRRTEILYIVPRSHDHDQQSKLREQLERLGFKPKIPSAKETLSAPQTGDCEGTALYIGDDLENQPDDVCAVLLALRDVRKEPSAIALTDSGYGHATVVDVPLCRQTASRPRPEVSEFFASCGSLSRLNTSDSEAAITDSNHRAILDATRTQLFKLIAGSIHECLHSKKCPPS